jgi:ATP synthase protein I
VRLGFAETGCDTVDRNQLRLLAVASQLGFGIAGPLIVFIAGGVFLDKKVGTSPLFLLIGVVFGMIGAGYAMYDLVRKLPTGRPPPKRPDRSA